MEDESSVYTVEFPTRFAAGLLVTSSGAFFATGLALFITGLVVQMRYNAYYNFIPSKQNALAMALAILGSVVMLDGLLGIFGTVHESRMLLGGFLGVLLFILIFEFFFAFRAFKHTEETESGLRDLMVEAATNYNNPNSKGVTEMWDYIHQKFLCCGTNGVEDWVSHKYMHSESAPDSCCVEDVEGCGMGVLAGTNYTDIVFDKGCFDMVKESLLKDNATFNYILIGIVITQILMLLFAICIFNAVRR